MSNNIGTPVFIILIFSFFSSCAQSKHHKIQVYTIDSSIVSEVNKKIEPFNRKANANISFAVYENEKEIIRKNDVPAISFTSFTNNIIGVDCLNGINEGFGFFLMIGKDTSFVNLKMLSNNDSILFRSAKDTTLLPELLVNNVNRKVTLAHEPAFAQDEIIQGIVELESEYFYEMRNKRERKLKFWIKVFLKSEPVPIKNNQYKTLVK